MRRQDRELHSREDIIAVIKKCTVCRVAFSDEPYPYIVPLNFGFEEHSGQLTLWFHCAPEGRKIDLLRHSPKVAFEMDSPGRYIDGETACDSTIEFESVCGNGTLEILTDAEKIPALDRLMRQYSDKPKFQYDERLLKTVAVLKLTVHEVTGKRLKLNT